MLNFYAHKEEHTKVEYTFEEFIFRLKKLEKVCNKENLDSILLITGVFN